MVEHSPKVLTSDKIAAATSNQDVPSRRVCVITLLNVRNTPVSRHVVECYVFSDKVLLIVRIGLKLY